MRNTQPMSLSRQVRAVAMSYFTRPGIRWALIAVVAGFVCQRAGSPGGYVLRSLLDGIGMLTVVGGLVGLMIVFFTHARQQLMGPFARVTPHTRQANLIVAGVMMPVGVLIFTVCITWANSYPSFLGVFAAFLGFVILVGYAFCRPWLVPLMVVAGFLAFHYTNLDWNLNHITTDFASIYARDAQLARLRGVEDPSVILQRRLGEALREELLTGKNTDYLDALKELAHARTQITFLRANSDQQFYEYWLLTRLTLILGDVLALIALGWLARPTRTARVSLVERVRRMMPEPAKAYDPVLDQKHRFIGTQLSRGLHRRFAVHDWRAAGVAAIAMLGLTIWFNFQWGKASGHAPSVAFNGDWFNSQFGQDAAAGLTMMLAFLPGALVAIGWRERWANFDFESLYPVSRRQFVTDMAAGLMLDAAEFWIAAATATLLACLCMRVGFLGNGRFWAALLVGGMMQFLWLGGIFFIGQRRQTLSYVAGLTPVALAIFLPLESLWRWDRPISVSLTVTIAVLEMLVGIAIFFSTWAFLQRGSRSAPSMPT
jgi:hypothetical protein